MNDYSLKFELNPNYFDGKRPTSAEMYYNLWIKEKIKNRTYERWANYAIDYLKDHDDIPHKHRKKLMGLIRRGY